ncbi:hypothetical protein CB1_000273062 [Camelus ferus]|nr:hypothetical protein CB1_000273062 [Camelus ferus]
MSAAVQTAVPTPSCLTAINRAAPGGSCHPRELLPQSDGDAGPQAEALQPDNVPEEQHIRGQGLTMGVFSSSLSAQDVPVLWNQWESGRNSALDQPQGTRRGEDLVRASLRAGNLTWYLKVAFGIGLGASGLLSQHLFYSDHDHSEDCVFSWEPSRTSHCGPQDPLSPSGTLLFSPCLVATVDVSLSGSDVVDALWEVLRMRGTLSQEHPWEAMPDLYFYRDPEEIEKEEQAAAEKAVTKEEFQGEWTAPTPEAADRSEGVQVPSVPVQQFPPEDWGAQPAMKTGLHLLLLRPPNGSQQPLSGRELFFPQTLKMEIG